MAVSFSCTEKKQSTLLKIGIHEEPKTVNFWLAGDRNSRKVLSLIYQPLYSRDPETLQPIPWLADGDPVYDEQTLSYTVKIKPAKWSDGSDVTSEDVVFTGRLIKEFKIPRYVSRWDFINKIEPVDRHTVTFFLDRPKAVFTTRTLTTAIVQKNQWLPIYNQAKQAEKPLITLLNHKIENPIGTGPFVLKEWRHGTYLYLEKNRHFFGLGKTIGRHVLGPYVDGIILKVFGTSDTAVLALQKGTIDMFWWNIQPGYFEELKKNKEIQIHSNEQSALYYLGFNVRKAPFNDPNLRRAIAVLIDKDFIISRILQGYGTKMDSIVPPGNRFWHHKDIPKYGDKLCFKERLKKACHILMKAGYTWETHPIDQEGNPRLGKSIKYPDGSPIKPITIYTPPADYDPFRALSGTIIQEWLIKAGFPVTAKPMAFSSLIDKVKRRHEFDAFILGYGNLDLDPDWIRNFFLSTNNKKGGWNMSGYENPEFDRIALLSADTTDRQKRSELIKAMQNIILTDLPYIPLYNPKLNEAVRKDKYKGWVETLGGIGNIWSFCCLKPE